MRISFIYKWISWSFFWFCLHAFWSKTWSLFFHIYLIFSLLNPFFNICCFFVYFLIVSFSSFLLHNIINQFKVHPSKGRNTIKRLALEIDLSESYKYDVLIKFVRHNKTDRKYLKIGLFSFWYDKFVFKKKKLKK